MQHTPYTATLITRITRAANRMRAAIAQLIEKQTPVPPQATETLEDLDAAILAFGAMTQEPPAPSITVRITIDSHAPQGKIADADVEFLRGPLTGLRLIGFAVWENRYNRGRNNVTFPARSYMVNGDRRSFALLRPTGTRDDAHDRLRDCILDALTQHQDGPVQTSSTWSYDDDRNRLETRTPEPSPSSSPDQDERHALTENPAPETQAPTQGTQAHQDARQEDTDRAGLALARGITQAAPIAPVSEKHRTIADVANDTWHTFTPNERRGVSFGIFPAEKMEAAQKQLPDSPRRHHELTVALMQLAAAQPRPQAQAPQVRRAARF